MRRLCGELGIAPVFGQISWFDFPASPIGERPGANLWHLENEIVGEALVALRHEELKEMAIMSVGHRLTILKGVYDIKVKQEVPIDSDHYIPPCTRESPPWVSLADSLSG